MHTHQHSSNDLNINESYALLRHMASHNSKHTAELSNTAELIKNSNAKAYEQIQIALENYRKADECLKTALDFLVTEE